MRKLYMATLVALAAPVAAQNADTAGIVVALAKLQSATSPTLSPDGKRLAYLSNASGSPQVWVRDLASGTSKQVTMLPNPVGQVQWSPNGDWLAYTVLPGGGLNLQIWVMAADGSGAKRLTAGGKETNALSGWTRDGKSLRAGDEQGQSRGAGCDPDRCGKRRDHFVDRRQGAECAVRCAWRPRGGRASGWARR